MTYPTARLLAAFLAVLAVMGTVGCAGGDGESAPGERIQGLVPGDTILVSDQVGSLLGELDEHGRRLTTVSLAPYGLSRHDDSSETRKYSGASRDGALGLDQMGARFYAPDLGAWTLADPIALSAPQWQVTEEFGAAHPYAYANHRPLIAADRDGRFWHVAVGALVGAAWGAGAESLSQYLEHGRIVDGGRIQAAALGGGVTGGLVALNPAAGFVRLAAAEVIGGAVERAAGSGGRGIGTPTDVALDVAGAVGGKSLELLGAAGKKVVRRSEAGALGAIPDHAVVCRAGMCTADRFANGTGVTVDSAGRVHGVSVGTGQTVEAASAGFLNGRVGATTAGRIRAAGGEVVPSRSPRNPNHATVVGVTPDQAEQLFTPTVPNPSQRP